jgi:hypothetical protein
MSTIKKFLQEASLRGNKATSDEYLRGIENRASQDIRGTEQRLGPDMGRFMQMVGEVQRMQNSAPNIKSRLEALAEKTIMDAYGSILGDTVLNIKFPKDQAIPDMMEEAPDQPEPAAVKKLEDQGLIDEVQKRKISNNITQGEAKNAKRMLVMPEVREGLVQIFGEEAGLKYLSMLSKITDIASALDWKIPMEVQKEMWTRDKSGFAGSVKVTWENPNTDEDLAKKILDDLEQGDMDNSPAAEEAIGNMQPTINALGTDFAMLLHEAIKGIYELIASAGIPEDEGSAETVLGNTDTLADEIEDLRYGPYLAADLRDFINQFPEASTVDNMREFVFGKLMQMPAAEFLALMKGIFSREESAKAAIKSIIDEIRQEIQDWELGNAIGFDTEEEPGYGNYSQTEPAAPETEASDEDYASMSTRELDAAIDAALDARDYDLVAKISKYRD